MTVTQHVVKASPLNRIKEKISSPFGSKKGSVTLHSNDAKVGDENNQIPSLKLSSSDLTQDSTSGSSTATSSALSKSKKRALRRQRAKRNRKMKEMQPQQNQDHQHQNNEGDIEIESSSNVDGRKAVKKTKRKKKTKKNNRTKSATTKDLKAMSSEDIATRNDSAVLALPSILDIVAAVDTEQEIEVPLFEDANKVVAIESVSLENTMADVQIDVYADTDADEIPSDVFGRPNSKKENCECNACVIS